MSRAFEPICKYLHAFNQVNKSCIEVISFEWISESNILSRYQILYGTMRILRDPEHISQHEDERAGPFAFYGVTYQIQPSVCCQNLILFVLEEGERNNTYRSTDELISLKHHLLLLHLHAAL